MRILHTADVHLGLRPSGARFGAAAALLRRARGKALSRLVELAREREADLVLVAGDLFDLDRPDPSVARAALDTLAGCGVPVAVIPGNHDPLVPGALWDRQPWESPPETVRVLRTSEPVERPWGLDLVLYPCPLLAKDGAASPVAWIREARAERGAAARFHVGVAHGTVMRMPDFADTNFPIQPEEPATLGLDYLALGHWHGSTPQAEAVANRFAYSGATEPTKFGEPEGGALLVDLDESADAPPKIERLATGAYVFRDESAFVAEAHDVSALAARLLDECVPDRTFLRVKLKGTAPLAAFEEAHSLGERLREAGLAYSDVDASDLHPEPQDIELARLPQGLLRRTFEILVEEAAGAEGDDGEAARRAVALAWEILGSGG